MRRFLAAFVKAFFLATGIAIAVSETACVPASDDPLELQLRKAGRNRNELEKVLSHYSSPADSLRRRAAEFLILHMDAYTSRTDERFAHFCEHLQATRSLKEVELNRYVDSIGPAFPEGGRVTRKSDLSTISAQFLIANIDDAFSAWESAPWRNAIDFRTFCNYILPYKSGSSEPQPWRRQYREAFAHLASSVDQPDVMMDVVDTLLASTRPTFRFIHNPPAGGDFTPQELLDIRAGQCGHWSHTVNYMLRAFGIPGCLITAPRWATIGAGHVWNGIPDSSGAVLPYSIEWKDPYVFNPMNWPLKTGKLYMLPYEKNPQSLMMQAPGRKAIPRLLDNPCMVDVTARYVPVVDIPVSLHDARKHDDVVYLCVFGRDTYEALDWSTVRDGRALFKDCGRDVVYVPAYYDRKGYTPASDPVCVTWEGEITSLRADTTVWRDVRLYRKYPLKSSMFKYTQPFMGMRIQVSDDRDFADARDIHVIDRYPSPVLVDPPRERDRWKWETYEDSLNLNKTVTTRYLRFFAAPGKECIVGDIACFDPAGAGISASAYGSKPGAEHVLDGLYGETYHDPDTLGWIALDFGKPVQISQIKYLPSHDSNSIQAGDRYELYYWSDGWVSLGAQTAENKWLDYRVPGNALLWLKNLDRGKEERIFTIDEQGEQVWW